MKKTVMVTGGTGYLGGWVVKLLLDAGYTVRMTVRDRNREDKYAPLLSLSAAAPGELKIYEADLLQAGSFDEAAAGADAVIHVASPFTLRFKDPQKELIEPAVNGTRNVLMAANHSKTVQKIILTSSVAAILGDNADMQAAGRTEITEDQFNETSSSEHQPYSYSKVQAEKTAWDICKNQDQWKLIVMNPAFIMGPAVTPLSNSGSLQFMRDMLSGRYRLGAPALEFGYVDVRDVARAHLLGLASEKAEGRFILSERVMSMWQLAEMIKAAYPGRFKLPLMRSPKFMLYLVGWAFGLSPKYVKRNIGYSINLNNSKSIRDLGLHYTPIETAIRDMVDQLMRLKLV
ncbi:MAG: NAD-dependent epimerase/dehydratase family protein [FCB group bacterium]|nr:NAD-dependent epimerase/dehydratase family protein [FCB group bacterium]